MEMEWQQCLEDTSRCKPLKSVEQRNHTYKNIFMIDLSISIMQQLSNLLPTPS